MITLIQFRQDQSGPHEVACVFEALGRPYGDLNVINAFSDFYTADRILEATKQSKLIILGGRGEGGYEDVSEEGEKLTALVEEKLAPSIRYALQNSIGCMGLCYGHQVIASVLGGVIEIIPNEIETGIIPFFQTANALEDDLFVGVPKDFFAVVGHKASVIQLPPNAVRLVKSDIHNNHAFRIGDSMYGFQFHPELTRESMEYRLQLYPEYRDYVIEGEEHNAENALHIFKNAVTKFL